MSEGDSDPDPTAVETTVREYYDALVRGEPLYPYFDESTTTVKLGVGETRLGYDDVAEALREQSRLTDGWDLDSRRLTVDRTGDVGFFTDLVRMVWTAEGTEHVYDTRWTGALRQRDEEWVFVSMHVSVAHDPSTGRLVGFGTNHPLAGTE
jgi:hypothetical protein